MDVRMYECGFGDCFRLRNKNRNDLYVDFGIHNSSMNLTKRNKCYDRIISDMNKKVDFLLTHYHDDHFAGAIYMSSNSSKKFRNVYIPDVWNINGSVAVVFLILLRGLLAKSTLKKG